MPSGFVWYDIDHSCGKQKNGSKRFTWWNALLFLKGFEELYVRVHFICFHLFINGRSFIFLGKL